jgi:hypothetical protein
MKNITLNDLLDGQPDKQTKGLLTALKNSYNPYFTDNPTITSINVFLKSHDLGYISASDTLRAVYRSLSDEQQDNLGDWGILIVSELRDYLIDLISGLKGEADSDSYRDTVCALSDLLDHSDDDEYVTYDETGVQNLDFDTLYDALDVD